MLIAFDEYKYPKAGEDKPRSIVIWLNPIYVVSVTNGGKDKFDAAKSHVVMDAREDEESNFSYMVVGEKDYIASIINEAITYPVTHAQSV